MKATRHELAGAAPLLSAFCVLSMLMPAQSRAEATDDSWQWRATVYLWLPSLGGETAFPPPSNASPPIDVSADKLLDSLNLAFMGTARAGPSAGPVFPTALTSGEQSRTLSLPRRIKAAEQRPLLLRMRSWRLYV